MENYESIDIKRIIEIAFSKIILIVTIVALCLAFGYGYSYYYKTPKYNSSVTILLVGDESEYESQKEVTQTDLTLNTGLISTYSNIATSESVLEKAIQNLDLNISAQELQKNVTAKQVNTTQFLKISVNDYNPEQASNIANEIAKVFTEEIKTIYNIENINIVDDAEIAKSPYNINHIKDMIVFGFLGIVLSGILITIIYLFDDTIKNEKEIEPSTNIKNLGTLPYDKNNQGLVVENNPKSQIVECIKTLRTNILFATNKKTILFTSYIGNEGKSWVINNLAIAIAQTDKKVILVDSNLRSESEKISKFEIEKGEGLSDFVKEITENKLDNLEKSKKYIKETKIPNLHILQNGTIPPNPVALLSSSNMRRLLELLKSMYDVVLIDGIACSEVSDSIALSSMVDSTILIAENEKTKISDIKKVKRAIEDVNGKILGIILNKAKVKKGGYYGKKYGYGYGYGYGYYYGGHNDEIGKIEEQEKTIISIDEIIETARENIKNELENKKEDIKDIEEIKENNDIEQNAEIQREIHNFGTELKSEIKNIKSFFIRNKREEKIDAQFNELNEKVEAINFDDKFENLNEKVEAINFDDKFENLNEKVEAINFDDKFENLNEKVEAINFDDKFKDLNEKIESINYERIMNLLVEQVMKEIEGINEEIKKIKSQQENNNVELLEEIGNIELEKFNIIEKINEIEQSRIEQNAEILEKINKIEENNMSQNEKILQKLEQIEADNKLMNNEKSADKNKEGKINEIIDNIISFEELKERSKILHTRVFNINQDIRYEDLEALSTTVIDLKQGNMSEDVALK